MAGGRWLHHKPFWRKRGYNNARGAKGGRNKAKLERQLKEGWGRDLKSKGATTTVATPRVLRAEGNPGEPDVGDPEAELAALLTDCDVRPDGKEVILHGFLIPVVWEGAGGAIPVTRPIRQTTRIFFNTVVLVHLPISPRRHARAPPFDYLPRPRVRAAFRAACRRPSGPFVRAACLAELLRSALVRPRALLWA